MRLTGRSTTDYPRGAHHGCNAPRSFGNTARTQHRAIQYAEIATGTARMERTMMRSTIPSLRHPQASTDPKPA